ncbi:MAG: DUF2283 domain-containing protein [Chloroflexi bacterium]|nr:DUF2283 domain-containing protein [Chloroflexota bacterium]
MGGSEVRISYDARVDALYIKLIPGKSRVVTTTVDSDINLDFDERDRLVGIEVLEASKRLDLPHLFPVEWEGDYGGQKLPSTAEKDAWDKLRSELVRRKQEDIPVETLVKHCKNWVEDVSEDFVIVRRDEGGECKITRDEFENGTEEMLETKRKWAITRALRELASSL